MPVKLKDLLFSYFLGMLKTKFKDSKIAGPRINLTPSHRVGGQVEKYHE
jgi:hypothetical protein